MKFNKDEISLCKQVAERHKKPLENFDLVIGTYLSGKEFVGYFHKELLKEKLMKARLDEVMFDFCETAKTTKPMIPLWTISDCLEFLEEKGLNLYFQFMYFPNGNWRFTAEDNRYGKVRGEGKTRLEACLKAVLAVLEEGK